MVTHTHLKRARLPVPPRPHMKRPFQGAWPIIADETGFVNMIFTKKEKEFGQICRRSHFFLDEAAKKRYNKISMFGMKTLTKVRKKP